MLSIGGKCQAQNDTPTQNEPWLTYILITRPKYGYIWFPSCILAAAFIYLYLPEVKDRTLEEIDEMVRLISQLPKPPTLFYSSFLFWELMTIWLIVIFSQLQFAARLPARKFRGHKCMISEVAHKNHDGEHGLEVTLEKPVMDATIEIIEHARHR